MDLQSDCYAYNQNTMLVSSVDPLVNETFSLFHESMTEMEQQFNAKNNSFATVSDEMLLEKPVIEDSVITKNQSSQGTSSTAQDDFQFATEEGISGWSVNGLPMFPDMQMFPNFISMDEDYQQIPTVDELRQELEPTQFATNNEQLQQASESTKLPTTDEQLQLESEPTQFATNNEQLQQASESTKLPTTDEQLQLESEPTQFATNNEQLQQASESTKLPTTDEQLQLESEPTQFATNNEQLQQASESTKLPTTDEQLQLESKLTQMLRKPTKKRSIKNPTHEYNTRRNAYKKSIEEFLKAQSKITEEARKKSCPPKLFKTHAGDVWIYPKDQTQILLLKCDIKPIKRPNYALKRKYKSKKVSK